MKKQSRSYGIQYVGGASVGGAGGSNNVTLSYTSLTGGIGTEPEEGDIVILLQGSVNYTIYNSNLNVPSGYTSINYTSSSDTYDARGLICYKIMGATPDTSVSRGSNHTACGFAMAVLVFRGVDTSTPLDVTSSSSVVNNTGYPDPASITPITNGAFIVVAGVTGLLGVGTHTNSYCEDFHTASGNDNYDTMAGMGYVEWTSGVYNPAAFGTTIGTNSFWSTVSYTIALRPA